MGPRIELEKRQLSISGKRRNLKVGSGNKSGVQQDVFVVPDRVSFKIGDRAARLFKNALGCCCVPLHGGAVARINIGSALSNETKLKRTAHDHWFATFRLGESFLLRSMAAANHDARASGCCRRNFYALGDLTVRPIRAGSTSGEIQFIDHRRIDHSKNRPVLLDQGDVHSEFAGTMEEFLRAIEWIDHPEMSPGFPLVKGTLDRP